MIRKAQLKDLIEVLKIYDNAREYIKTYNSPQWQTGYPNKESFLEDLKNEELYVNEVNGKIVSVATLLTNEPTYEKIAGAWLNKEEALVIHRIATAENAKNKGYAKDFLDFANQILGYNNIKIDTHELNEPMKNFLIKNGFIYCGVIRLFRDFDNKRLAYQKVYK